MAEGIEEQVHAYADQTAQLEAVLNTMEDGVLVLGPRGHIRRCNLALGRAFPGVGNARGRQCVEVIPHP
ncbi:PAS domain-containing sensor histidine kinase, partial [Xanthomonas citri pv. citri]|nr:PAS domain-containing sensor histidine kinase [Xanthomonas citri pv. citri]